MVGTAENRRFRRRPLPQLRLLPRSPRVIMGQSRPRSGTEEAKPSATAGGGRCSPRRAGQERRGGHPPAADSPLCHGPRAQHRRVAPRGMSPARQRAVQPQQAGRGVWGGRVRGGCENLRASVWKAYQWGYLCLREGKDLF